MMNGGFLLLYVVAFVCAFSMTVFFERLLLPRLRSSAKQPIYSDGPRWHVKKAGTPTMGGIAFIIGIDFVLLLLSLMLFKNGFVTRGWLLICTVGYATLNGAVGIADDLRKLKKQENKGLSALQKILLQTVLAAVYMLAIAYIGIDVMNPAFSFGRMRLGIFYYPIAFIILLGITNCANLTDGVDGLASCVAFGIGAVLLLLSHSVFPDVSLSSAALMGGTTGFLVYNLNPARVFMGDTGSLFLGAMVAACAFASGNMFLAVILGIVYVLEGCSVILQVMVFKITGKRIFKMAPMHHHLEKIGWSENAICILALIVTLSFGLVAVLLFCGGIW